MKIQTVIASSLLVIALAAGELSAQVTDNSASNHVFAQFADGRFSDGTSYRSTVMVSSDSLSPINCTAVLNGLTVTGFGDGATLTFTIIPGGWYIYRTPGTQTPFRDGYMTLSCNAAVTAQVLYTFRDSSGLVLSEATVFSSPAATIAQLLADQRDGAQLGIAITNTSNVAKEFVVVAFNSSSTEIGRRSVHLNARTQTAAFLGQLISLPVNHVGEVHIYTNTTDIMDVYAIGLRFTGVAFTTTPVTIRTPR